MTTKEILNLSSAEISKLKKPQLRKAVQILSSAANKRLKRLEQKGVSTPATRYANKTGRFSTKGKNINQLRAEFIRVKNFMESKTSTLTGYKKFKKEVQNKLINKGIKISSENIDNVFKIYEKIKDMDSSVAERSLKYTVLQEINEMIIDKQDEQTILEKIANNLNALYEQEQELENESISDFFRID